MQDPPSFPRRRFLENVMAGATSATVLAGGAVLAADAPADKPPQRKIKLGIIGVGSRGLWIADLFRKHGGYAIHALADYFPETARAAGEKLGVEKSRRFSGLSGYKKLLASGVEAVAIEDVPYFYPEQARAAIEAGLHVYMAKPVAVDVPGCLAIGATGRLATEKKLCFLIDYQLPTDAAIIEVARRVRRGDFGALAHVVSLGFGLWAWADPPLGPTIENLLHKDYWISTTALGGDTIVAYDIHIIDTLLWMLQKRPTRACGFSRTCRPEPHGDRTDCAEVVYQFADGPLWTHSTQTLDNNWDTPDLPTLSANLLGMKATAHVQYDGKVYVRGGPGHFAGKTGGPFYWGVIRNIAEFHKNICAGRCDNPTLQRAVDGTLTAILGREAAARRCYLTMDELLKENRRLEVDLRGLKA